MDEKSCSELYISRHWAGGNSDHERYFAELNGLLDDQKMAPEQDFLWG
jgi:hypothetical protein